MPSGDRDLSHSIPANDHSVPRTADIHTARFAGYRFVSVGYGSAKDSTDVRPGHLHEGQYDVGGLYGQYGKQGSKTYEG